MEELWELDNTLLDGTSVCPYMYVSPSVRLVTLVGL